MDEEVVVNELLNGEVGGDCENVSGHDVADADAVKCFSHLGLSETCLRTGSDEPSEEDYPYAIDKVRCRDYEQHPTPVEWEGGYEIEGSQRNVDESIVAKNSHNGDWEPGISSDVPKGA